MFCFFQDIDECQENTHNCHEDGECINTDGSFRCECKVGFIGSGETCSGIELYQLKRKASLLLQPTQTLPDHSIDMCWLIEFERSNE